MDQRFYEVFGRVQKDGAITSGEEKDFWKKVVLTVFEPYSEKRNLDPLFEELWELFARGEHWRLAEGAKDTLSDLRNRGYSLAVLSNNDSRLRSVLADLSIDSPVRKNIHFIRNGCRETRPRIFRKVEEAFGKKPSDFLHLGDSYSRDFEGARQAGWDALLFGKPVIEKRQITAFPELIEWLP